MKKRYTYNLGLILVILLTSTVPIFVLLRSSLPLVKFELRYQESPKTSWDFPLEDKFEYVEPLPGDLPTVRPLALGNMSVQEFDKRERAFIRYISTLQFDCRNRVRAGSNEFKDGGWEVCVDRPFLTKNKCLVYSFGINNDWSFDEYMSTKFGCLVHAFDPSMSIGDHVHSRNVLFHQMGLWGENTVLFKRMQRPSKWTVKTLGTIINALGHNNTVIDVLKIDIEYAEWSAFNAIFKEGVLRQVKQLLIEFHLNDNEKSKFKNAQAVLIEKIAKRQKLNNQVNTTPDPLDVAVASPSVSEALTSIKQLGFRIFYSKWNYYSRQQNINTKRTIYFAQEVHFVNVNFCKTCKDFAREVQEQ